MKALNLLAGLMVGVLALPQADAELFLPPTFSDHAVIQRDEPVKIWGEAGPGEKVSVQMGKQSAEASAAPDGAWVVTLPAFEAGGPYSLTVSTPDETRTVEDILVGEVWICSGQSNMAWPMRNTVAGEAAIAAASNPNLRILRMAGTPSTKPNDRFSSSGWGVAGPDNLSSFSGVGYYFGSYLQEALGVPVGIITAAVGGTRIEAWMPEASIRSAEQTMGRKISPEGNPGGNRDPAVNAASALYNGAIHPLRQTAARGWIWYQGEANAARAWAYRTLLSEMILGWRSAWGRDRMPFVVVQLPGFAGREDNPHPTPIWAELREAQLAAVEALDAAQLIATTDLGVRHDIHPPDKKPVADRIGQIVVSRVYEAGVGDPRFPVIRTVEFPAGKAIVTVDAGGGKLKVDGPKLEGFAVRAEGGDWFPAEATLEGDRVTLTSSRVPNPDAVRYNWENDPTGNLISSDGLPTIPFRSDDDPPNSRDRT